MGSRLWAALEGVRAQARALALELGRAVFVELAIDDLARISTQLRRFEAYLDAQPSARLDACGDLLTFLRELRDRWGSWTRAVGSYHSNTPALSSRYRLKVFRALYAEKHRIAKARRATRLAALEAKREAPGPQAGNQLRPPSAAPSLR